MLIVENGKILTMAGTVYENGYILVDDGRIIEVGHKSEMKVDTTGAIVIDAKGGYILPGFVDAHCHIGIVEDSVGFEGRDLNEAIDPVTPHLRAIDGIYHDDRALLEARENGVTTVVTGPGSANVVGGQFAAIKTYGSQIEEMIIKEPVAIKVAFGENPKKVYYDKKQTPMTRMATAALLREVLVEAIEYKKSFDEYNKNMETGKKPKYDLKMEALVKVLNKEIPFKVHAHRSDDIFTALRIAKEFDVNITLEHCTDGHLIKDLLAKEGVPVVAGPLITHRIKVELRNHSLSNPAILAKAGIKVAIMSDHPCIPTQFLVLCAAIAAREGMAEEDALKAITINAAEIAGIQNRVGSIEVGKDADIVLFNGHPFDIRSRTVKTIINGKVVFDREL